MGVTVTELNAEQLLAETCELLEAMFKRKRVLANNLARKAEELSLNHTYDDLIKITYPDAKRLYDPDLELTNMSVPPIKPEFENDKDKEEFRKLWEDPPFFPVRVQSHPLFRNVPVNLSMSSVHVPIDVYYGRNTTKNSLKWSAGLDSVFKSNHHYDPKSYWQFFCSTSGFLRIYPLHHWRYPEFFKKIAPPPPSDQPQYLRPLDLYDCRTTPWFIKAAASPKDIVILFDTSGSMKGQRQLIAKEVVSNLLDTLTEDDFVSAFNFSWENSPLSECFKFNLVSGNRKFIYEYKSGLSNLSVNSTSGTEEALKQAYKILHEARIERKGAYCNQAIMLVTDGATSDYQEIIDLLDPEKRVRIFTFLVGKEVTDIKDTRNMACNNRGNFYHIKDLSNIREHIQKYIQVLSRPMVLDRENLKDDNRPYAYTSVLADVTDIPLTPWIWDTLERENIREAYRRRYENITKRNKLSSSVVQDDEPIEEDEQEYEDYIGSNIAKEKYTVRLHEIKNDIDNIDVDGNEINRIDNNRNSDYTKDNDKLGKIIIKNYYKIIPKTDLMTTISVPVFDLNDTSEGTANLLGVAGVDIPLREIVKTIPLYKIPVNGYPFVINNNGYVLFHPDLRPLFQGLLKPFFTSVDLLEVELIDNGKDARIIDDDLNAMRTSMLDRKKGCKTLKIKSHIDFQTRVITRSNKYCWAPINDTPFSIAIALPIPYGLVSINSKTDVLSGIDFSEYFKDDNWRLHPDWLYCENNPSLSDQYYDPSEVTSEKMIKKFIKQWKLNGESSIDWISSLSTNAGGIVSNKLLFCDREIVERLLFDAKATNVDLNACQENLDKSFKDSLKQVFISTRSGLTRFKLDDSDNYNYEYNYEDSKESSSSDDILTRSVDQLYYRRSIDFEARFNNKNYNNNMILLSLPFNTQSSDILSTTITISSSYFIRKDRLSAPLYSYGLKLDYNYFGRLFFDLASGNICNNNNEDIDCMLIDDSGYIIIMNREFNNLSYVQYAGQFLGEYDHDLFNSLLNYKIYNKVKLYDYQAICIIEGERKNSSNKLLSPFVWLYNLLNILWYKLYLTLMQLYLTPYYINSIYSDFVGTSDYDLDYIKRQFNIKYENTSSGNLIAPLRTKFYPCDKEFYLYQINNIPKQTMVYNYLKDGCNQSYILQAVEGTNVLLLIVNNECQNEPNTKKIYHQEVNYENECDKYKHQTDLYHKRPSSCHSYTIKEANLSKLLCGDGTYLQSLLMMIYLPLVTMIFQNFNININLL